MKLSGLIIAVILSLSSSFLHAQVAGSLDPSFDPNVFGNVVGLGIQPDGKMVIDGSISQVGGQPKNRVARILPSGAVESTAGFNSGTGPDAFADGVVILPDKTMLLVGAFWLIDGSRGAALRS